MRIRVRLEPQVRLFVSYKGGPVLSGLAARLRGDLAPWGVEFHLDPSPHRALRRAEELDGDCRALIDSADALLVLWGGKPIPTCRMVAEYRYASGRKPICLLRFPGDPRRFLDLTTSWALGSLRPVDPPFDPFGPSVVLAGVRFSPFGVEIDEELFQLTVSAVYSFAAEQRPRTERPRRSTRRPPEQGTATRSGQPRARVSGRRSAGTNDQHRAPRRGGGPSRGDALTIARPRPERPRRPAPPPR